MTDSEHQGLITASAVCIAVTFALWLGLKDPWWTAITALIVSNPEPRALVAKSLMRLLGTVAGAIAGYFLALQIEDAPFVQASVVFVLALLGTYARFRLDHAYAWSMALLMPVLMIYLTMDSPDQLYPFAVYRCYEIGLGVVAAGIASVVLAPVAQGSAAPLPPELPEHTAVLRWSLVAGILAVLIPVVWSLFELPSLIQIGITVLIMIDRTAAATQLRGLKRLYGCLLGGSVGLLMIPFARDAFLVWLATLFVGMFVFARLHHSKSPWAYVGTQAGIAFTMCFVTGNGPPDSIMPVINRFAGILSGVIILILVSSALHAWRAQRMGDKRI